MIKILRFLVIGSGGREHTIAKECAKSPRVDQVVVTPGNGGISKEFTTFSVPVEDNDGLVALAQNEKIDLVVVGPEVPLQWGGRFPECRGNISVRAGCSGCTIGGEQGLHQGFSGKIRTHRSVWKFFEVEPALQYLEQCDLPVVVKASGLAAGKGVLICESMEDARDAVEDMLSGESFGESGKEVVIEEFLDGEEASLHLICSGESYVAMPMSQDHKKVGDGDTG